MSRSTQTPQLVPVSSTKASSKPSRGAAPRQDEPRATATVAKPYSTGAVPKTKPAQPEAKSKKPKEFTLPAFSTAVAKEKQGYNSNYYKLLIVFKNNAF